MGTSAVLLKRQIKRNCCGEGGERRVSQLLHILSQGPMNHFIYCRKDVPNNVSFTNKLNLSLAGINLTYVEGKVTG